MERLSTGALAINIKRHLARPSIAKDSFEAATGARCTPSPLLRVVNEKRARITLRASESGEDPRREAPMVELFIMEESAAGPPDPLAHRKTDRVKYSGVVDF